MRWMLLSLLVFAGTLLTGCDQWTCEGACGQYYGDDGCGLESVRTDGTTRGQAEARCLSDCTNALYNSAGDRAAIKVLDGGNEDNAMEFIQCVADQDYSDEAFNTTCANLRESCGWFNSW